MKKKLYIDDLRLYLKKKRFAFSIAFIAAVNLALFLIPLEKIEEKWRPNQMNRCFIDLNAQIQRVEKEKQALEKALVKISEDALFPHPITDMRADRQLIEAFALKKEIVHRLSNAELAEKELSKRWVSNHLFKGVPSQTIKHPRLSRYFRLGIALLSGLVGAGIYFAFMAQYQSSKQGLPVSTDTLKKLGHNVIGDLNFSLSDSLPDEISETAKAVLKQGIDQSKHILGVIGRNETHPPTMIAELFARENHSVLLIDLTYRFGQELTPGLWQYLHNEIVECPISRRDGYDFLTLGKWRGDARDVASSVAFERLLKEKGQNYDNVILFAGVAPQSVEGIAIQKLCDGSVVLLNHESLQELQACPAVEAGTASFIYKE